MKKVVCIIIYDQSTQRVLSERRALNHPYYPNQTTFPTGKAEEEDANIEATLRREAKLED